MISDHSTVYILIPIHNKISETMKCLECIDRQTYSNLQIIIIDDGSTDTSSEIIHTKYPDIIILQGNGSLWWAGSLFIGIEYVLNYNTIKPTDYILTLNNDMVFDESFIEILVNLSKRYPNTVIGSMSYDKYTSKLMDSGVKIDWESLHFDIIVNTDLNIDVIQNVDVISTRGTLFPIFIIQSIGNFIPSKIRHYLSDYEFTIRARQKGYKLLTAKKAISITNTKQTGFHMDWNTKYKLSDMLKAIFSTKSSSNLKSWIYFIYFCCPTEYKLSCYWNITFRKILTIMYSKLSYAVRKG